jgi:hypothetical protein
VTLPSPRKLREHVRDLAKEMGVQIVHVSLVSVASGAKLSLTRQTFTSAKRSG